MTRSTLACLVLWSCGAGHVAAQDWPRFRGPGGHGQAVDASFPEEPTELLVRWRQPLRGAGHSSPVTHGGRVFVTAVGHTGSRDVLCLAIADGALQWRHETGFEPYDQHRLNSFASSTPVVDDVGVYVAWTAGARAEVVALDHAGRPRWRREIGPFAAHHGSGASPVLASGVLVVANDHEGEHSALLGLDPATGETLWELPRDSVRAAYSTPAVVSGPGGVERLVFTSTAHGITALDPRTGECAWQVDGLFEERCVGSAAIEDGVLFATAGSGGGGKESVALDLRTGSPPGALYRLRRALPYVPTAIGHQGHLFTFADGGIVSCIEARTGEVRWQERLDAAFYGSPICVNGVLYCVSLEGGLYALAAAEQYRPPTVVELGEGSQATPAHTPGRLLVRTAGHLLALAPRGGSAETEDGAPRE